MQLVITEKNDAAQKIADILADKKPRAAKVFDTPVYWFERGGEQWVAVGLRGHILEVDFVPSLSYNRRRGWFGIASDGEKIAAVMPEILPKPPFHKRKPFSVDAVDLKSWKLEALPYMVYAPLEKLPKEKGIIRSIKNLAAKADGVCIATDFDREGELIGADALAMALQANPNLSVSRARYSAFTRAEITSAFDNQVSMDFDLASAGESRQWIDLIWGAVLTRYLTIAKFAGFGNVRPSGRVQTPTLALVVAREKLRLAFVPEDFWVIKAQVTNDANNPQANFEATHAQGRFTDEARAKQVMAAVHDAQSGTVTALEKKRRKQAAPAPFSTTSLMTAASAEGLSPARTMRLAESLYMAGFISYPRVDNTVYPDSLDLRAVTSMLAEVPTYAAYAHKLLGQERLSATRGKTFDTDHPPVYPTAAVTSDQLRADEWKLYNLVARRFLATLSEAAVIEQTKIGLDINGEPFETKGDVLVEPGFRGIYPYGLKRDEQLPQLTLGQTVVVRETTLTKKQTEPPPRYSQGRLIQEMEKLGLGTKSTRHSIIERLIDVRYIQDDPLEPTALGIAVIDALGAYAPHVTTPQMTAALEDEMSNIASGRDSRDTVVAHSRCLLEQEMNVLIPKKDQVGEALAEAVAADARIGRCPTCGKDLLIRHSNKTRNSFIGCSGWQADGQGCNVTYPLPPGKIEAVEEACPTCGKPQIRVIQFRQKPLVRCVDPECPSNQEPDIDVGVCPTCQAAGDEGRLIAQRSPRTLKRFIRCTNYDICATSYPLPQRGQLTATDRVCEACGAPKVIVSTNRGPWELCPNPECPLRLEQEKNRAARAGKGTAPKGRSTKTRSTAAKARTGKTRTGKAHGTADKARSGASKTRGTASTTGARSATAKKRTTKA
ncbi:MAG: DNA topoisomerase I [Coriobacteriales bacterium]|nr:DNA topoisomerase I [Coriobacteriales bacterium]